MNNVPGEGFRVTDQAPAAIRAAGYSHRRLVGATLDYDLEKETEGFWLDLPDAASAALC